MIISMRVLVLGAGLMGAQIGCEYGLGGHRVTLVARRRERARERVEGGLALVRELGLFSPQATEDAGGRIAFAARAEEAEGFDLAVESLPEDLELKARLLRRVAGASPDAVLASNTSSLSITALGAAVGAPERVIGTHYWNPPLLSPLVEVVPGEATDGGIVARVRATLADLGKCPILVEADVPGFVWNRLQLALLRECVWLVENGVAAAGTVDEVVREGLARRWRRIGPFEAIALGGVETWERAARNLVPELSTAAELGPLARFVPGEEVDLARLAERRDRALAEELIRERGAQ
jgi:3-hydroxybutyryl-CoA dehydrogenase